MSARTSARRSRRRSTACTATSPAPTTSAMSSVRNRVVLTNKTPTGLNRGFGGPAGLLCARAADAAHRGRAQARSARRDPAQSRAVPGRFPIARRPVALLDSGDYPEALEKRGGARAASPNCAQRQKAARAEGRLYGIGLTAAVEPSVSNMGYITTVLTPEERRKAGPKNGAQATATDRARSARRACRCMSPRCRRARAIAPCWRRSSPTRSASSRPTSASSPSIDTASDAWSIASGNYSSRFAAGGRRRRASRGRAVEGEARARAPRRSSTCRRDDIEFAGGRVRAHAAIPTTRMPFARLAAASHWSPGLVAEDDQALRETVFWTPPQLTAADRGRRDQFVALPRLHFRFLRRRDRPRHRRGAHRQIRHHARLRPRAASRHGGGPDHRRLRAGARRGALRGICLLRRTARFLSGTFADYLLPTTTEVPEPLILHIETPSPFTPLGAKGVGEGNCMSTPVCIANAVADALGLAADRPAADAGKARRACTLANAARRK